MCISRIHEIWRLVGYDSSVSCSVFRPNRLFYPFIYFFCIFRPFMVQKIPGHFTLDLLYPRQFSEEFRFLFTCIKKERPPLRAVFLLAEKEGFEPSRPFWGLHDFQSCALDQTTRLLRVCSQLLAVLFVSLSGQQRYYSRFPPNVKHFFQKNPTFFRPSFDTLFPLPA